MVVLSHQPAQSIVINGDIRLTVSVKGDQVRIGIEAPPDVIVDREEARRGRGTFADTDARRERHEAWSA